MKSADFYVFWVFFVIGHKNICFHTCICSSPSEESHRCSRIVHILLFVCRSESVWKLSYVLKKNNTLVSSQKIVQASADVIMKSVNVTSPRGLTYTIVDVTETVRMEEVYQLYVTRKVFRDDVTHFTASLQETIENIVPGLS